MVVVVQRRLSVVVLAGESEIDRGDRAAVEVCDPLVYALRLANLAGTERFTVWNPRCGPGSEVSAELPP
jgi:hypothetical protein